MSMSALLSLSGMVNYRPDLFDLMVLPHAPDADELGVTGQQVRAAWTINKQDFVDFLCLQTRGMCLAVPDANWLKQAIGTWSEAHLPEWQRLFDTLFYKYNPLWNKDATLTEDYTDTYGKTNTDSGWVHSNGNSTSTGYTHGYNDGVVDPTDGKTWTHADKTKNESMNQGSQNMSHATTGSDSRARTVTEKGNIGVTMVQDMIEKERELAKFSIEEYLADEFKKNFCLLVW